MKKFTVKASALAIAAALPGLANAVVDLDVSPTGAVTYASELVTANVTGVTVAGGVQSVLGFGVSQNQDRYIRYDLTNAKFNAAVVASDLEVSNDVCANATIAADAVETVVQGGANGSSSVIFQITANNPAGLSPSSSCVELLSAAMPIVLTSTASGATVAYSLYETAADAVSGGSSGRLSYKSGSLAGVSPGVRFTTTTNTTTADVTTGYTLFTAASSSDGVGTTALIGNVTLGTNAGVKDLTGAADVTLGQLITVANLIVTGDDFTATSNTGVALDDAADCANAGSVTATGAVTSSTVRTIAANAGSAGLGVCFVPTGNSMIAVQDFTVALDVITPAAGSSAGDQSAIALGDFDKDGTILKASQFGQSPNQSVFVNLANVGNSDAPYTTRCFASSGAVSMGTPGTVTAGNTVKIGYGKLGCPKGFTAAEFTFSVPAGNVVGSVVSKDQTTGITSMDGMTGNQ